MIKRTAYLKNLQQLKDTDLIKVITGVRRSGKSTLLAQFREELVVFGVRKEQIIALNFEDLHNDQLRDYQKLYQYLTAQIKTKQKYYVFLDEIQNVEGFQRVVDSLYLNKQLDIYLTGSNAYLLSGELATLLSGRYVEIKLLPFSFSEYWSSTGSDKREAWKNYFANGGFPYAAALTQDNIRMQYLDGLYNTVLVKDILARKKIADPTLLGDIFRFLLDNIGNIVSSKKIADSLTTYGRKTSSLTVENYLSALSEAFIIYKADRYDIKGKQYLKSLSKYYAVDLGLRTLLLGNQHTDIGHLLENIVYLELLRRGYKVYIGKLDDREVDFVAMSSGGTRAYYQVAATALDSKTFAREIAPLKKIHDNYPKYLLTLDDLLQESEGIKGLNILDFLCS
jgi:predicted AAA+ superfamily ATPase